ncbi:MAG: C39 family peptidase [Planctomycetes bacterium]|nr:C39 family peptidase [Planctomycetota bacterium]
MSRLQPGTRRFVAALLLALGPMLVEACCSSGRIDEPPAASARLHLLPALGAQEPPPAPKDPQDAGAKPSASEPGSSKSTANAPSKTPPLILAGVPDVRQSTDYTCGCSALVAVLGYYGFPVDEKTVTREAKVDPEVGAELEDLAAVAGRRGLKASVKEHLTLDDLAKELSEGRPILVLNQSWRTDPKLAWKDAWDDGHYLVVIGLDRETVYVEDPSLEGSRGTIPRGEFVTRWHGWTINEKQTEGQALLVSGPRKLGPAPAARTESFEPVE